MLSGSDPNTGLAAVRISFVLQIHTDNSASKTSWNSLINRIRNSEMGSPRSAFASPRHVNNLWVATRTQFHSLAFKIAIRWIPTRPLPSETSPFTLVLLIDRDRRLRGESMQAMILIRNADMSAGDANAMPMFFCESRFP